MDANEIKEFNDNKQIILDEFFDNLLYTSINQFLKFNEEQLQFVISKSKGLSKDSRFIFTRHEVIFDEVESFSFLLGYSYARRYDKYDKIY